MAIETKKEGIRRDERDERGILNDERRINEE